MMAGLDVSGPSIPAIFVLCGVAFTGLVVVLVVTSSAYTVQGAKFASECGEGVEGYSIVLTGGEALSPANTSQIQVRVFDSGAALRWNQQVVNQTGRSTAVVRGNVTVGTRVVVVSNVSVESQVRITWTRQPANRVREQLLTMDCY